MNQEYIARLCDAYKRWLSTGGDDELIEIAIKAEEEIVDGTGNPTMLTLLARHVTHGAYSDIDERNEMVAQIGGIICENYLKLLA